ncbi:CNOT2-like protein [Mya arenaria]|uniref:CNOT2-like protein n=1 Tax=Mya arenaria TaxID=6604 RepID=A0ABY7EGY7_MYAAR|nr:CNOT2-like protein [Mya arenaria]
MMDTNTMVNMSMASSLASSLSNSSSMSGFPNSSLANSSSMSGFPNSSLANSSSMAGFPNSSIANASSMSGFPSSILANSSSMTGFSNNTSMASDFTNMGNPGSTNSSAFGQAGFLVRMMIRRRRSDNSDRPTSNDQQCVQPTGTNISPSETTHWLRITKHQNLISGSSYEQALNNKDKFPNDKQGSGPPKGVHIHADGRVTNIPQGMVADQFGMVGLLTFIRSAEMDNSLVALAPGMDLTTLGLNLNSPEYNRDWRYHKDERVWLTRPPGVEPIVNGGTYERGTYYFFDVQNWRKVPKEFHLEYEKLETRPTLPSRLYYNPNQPVDTH